jgi:probable HAF family extracellular repeat protein
MKPYVLIVLLACAAQFAAAQSSAVKCSTVEHYRVVALPLKPQGINNSGVVAGTSHLHGALWSSKKGLRELKVPEGFTETESTAINNLGHIVGTASDQESGKRQAFLYRNGRIHLLTGQQSKAADINDADDVVGEAVDHLGVAQPILWHQTVAKKLGACCGGSALAVNNRGQVVGQAYDHHAHYQAFLWDTTHKLRQIGPEGTYSSAVALNSAGDVIVQTYERKGTYVYKRGKLTKMKLAENTPSEPHALNRCGFVVGAAGLFSDAYRAFIWDQKNGFRDLNELIAKDSGWKLEVATDINDHGEVVGWGDLNGKEDTGFLLVPGK